MANKLYPLGRQAFADGTLNWASSAIKVMLVKTGYVYSDAHEFVNDLTPASYDNGRTGNLGSKTQALGLCTAANSSLTAGAATSSIALVVFYDTGSDATARLIAYIDTATGLPFTPAVGQTVNLNWDAVNGIFTL